MSGFPDYRIRENLKGVIFKTPVYDVYVKCFVEGERTKNNKQTFYMDYKIYKSGFKTEQEARDFISKQKPVEQPVFNEHISEPVVSFVKCFKQNHRRFKIERLNKIWDDHAEIKITDLVTKESYGVDIEFYSFGRVLAATTENLKWATSEELGYLFDEISTFLSDRKKKLTEIRNNKERQRLIGVYCK